MTEARPKTSPAVDAYIEAAAPFAQPILRYLRELVHEACPAVEETMKWRFPHFEHHGLMCDMGAFKEHCTFGFWQPERVVGEAAEEGAMGQFGRIRSVDDLPPRDALLDLVRKAAALNEAGMKPKRMERPRKPKPELEVPEDLEKALAENGAARRVWEDFSPSHRREYVEWITEAKRETTRAKRMAQTLEWLAEGKTRNWKYS